VQQAVHPDALAIFGATFDETLDDEIRVTVIATGFDEKPAKAAAAPAAAEAPAAEPAKPTAPTPISFEKEKEEEVIEDDDPFADIFKIFNR